MYLKALRVRGFRGIVEASVQWRKGVNVLVGENNSGKTAVIDALRLCLSLGDGQREIWVRREDYHISSDGQMVESIQFDLAWGDLGDEEKGVYIDMLAIPENGQAELQLHVRFDYDHERDRPKRPIYWGGEKEGQPISPDVLDLIEHVNLGALRDATRDLAPGRGNELSRLFLKLASRRDGQEKLAKEISDQIRGIKRWRRFLNRAEKRINEHLAEVSFGDAPQQVGIDFVESQFRQIVESLRIRIPAVSAIDGDPSFFNIWQNGLGYNNLIYMATVFGDLLKRRERFPYASLSLLIEEPEAHLHPQLQDLLFAYLQSIASRGIQVFLSSHSPTIAAKTDVDSLIILHTDGEHVMSTPIGGIELGEHKAFLERFLDVTKCQLFFAKSVILVEGISEALLLPCFARRLGDDFDLDKGGVEIINVCGVAFEPFARLFNCEATDKRLATRCVVITDDDRAEAAEGGGETPSSRAEKAQSLSGGLLKVVLAKRTFEYELYLANEDLVTSTYKELHPRTNIDFTGSIEEKALQFADKVHQNRDKAVLAQELAVKLTQDRSLRACVPPYIKKALRWALRGEWTEDNGCGTN